MRFMKSWRVTMGILSGALVLCGIPGIAETPVQLNVKSGLWETTSSTHMSGSMLPESYLKQLTPEQRQQAEEAIKRAQKPQTTRTCMTREKIMQDFSRSKDKNCQATMITNTSKSLEYRMVCSGSGSSTATIHLDAVSPELVKGRMEYSVSQGGSQGAHGEGSFSSKWISSSCGNVK